MEEQEPKFKRRYTFYALLSLIIINVGWFIFKFLLGPPYSFGIGSRPDPMITSLVCVVPVIGLGSFLLVFLFKSNNREAKLIVYAVIVLSLIQPIQILIKTTWKPELPPDAVLALDRYVIGQGGGDYTITHLEWSDKWHSPFYSLTVGFSDGGSISVGDVYCVAIDGSNGHEDLIVEELGDWEVIQGWDFRENDDGCGR